MLTCSCDGPKGGGEETEYEAPMEQPEADRADREQTNGTIVLISASQQKGFKDKVAERIAQMGYVPWSMEAMVFDEPDRASCSKPSARMSKAFTDRAATGTGAHGPGTPATPSRRDFTSRAITSSRAYSLESDSGMNTRAITWNSNVGDFTPAMGMSRSATNTGTPLSPSMSIQTHSCGSRRSMAKTPSGSHDTSRTPSGGRDASALSAFAKKMQESEVVGLVCILSRAFSKNPQCLEELQYAFKQHSNSKGILLLMYEDFEMSPEMMFMIGRHSQAVVQPSVRTKCKCERRCECTGELLIRAREIAEDWLTGLRAGGFSMSFLNAMKKKKYARESTVSNDSTEEWNPKEVHQKLLQELTSDMKLKSINDLLGFVGIIGSTAFYNPASESICREIGVRLAGVLPETVAVCTGGFTGTGECISRAFHDARIKRKRPHRTYMVLPTTDPDIETLFKDKAKTRVLEDGSTVFAPWDYGKTVFYGRSNAEKMAIMAVNSVLVMVEGGPGALKEALGCQQNGHWVVPVRCTGGATTNAEVGRQSPFKDLLRLASKKEAKWRWVLEAQRAWELLDAAEETDPAKVADAVVTVVNQLFCKQRELKECSQMATGVGSVANRPPGLQELEDVDDLISFASDFKAVVLFSGFGAKAQYGNMEEVEEIVKQIVSDLDDAYDEDWLVLYGGSPYLKDVKTIAHAVRLLHERYGKTVLAVQCDFYGKEMLAPPSKEAYAHMADGALYMYPTETALDEHFHKKILFGGYYRFCGDKQEKLCGASKVWYGPELAELDMISAHVVIGGGSLAADDANESYQQRIPTFYARTRLRHPPAQVLRPKLLDNFGQMEHWANAVGFPREEWYPHTPYVSRS